MPYRTLLVKTSARLLLMKVWGQIPVCWPWLFPVVNAICCNGCELWVKTPLNSKDHSCSDSSLSQSRHWASSLRVTVLT